ncbi:single-stranded DNA-binding protein [Phenylobacterium ferrooxidans]|uniref:Single-stranded DNA-binding protein n=1 Tax=Phenylobacterium ferrooxidans TaxID=2982689 RepID=A0ABW6CJD3_9CAUL
MAGSLNKVQLIGNVGADPEIKSLNSGDRVANLRIATSESWKDKSTGEKREKTEWHSVVVFGDGLVKVIESYVTKGSKIYISGALQTRKWQDQSGADRYSTEIVLKPFNGELILLSGRGDGGSGAGGGGQDQGGGQAAQTQQRAPAGEIDDSIPF